MKTAIAVSRFAKDFSLTFRLSPATIFAFAIFVLLGLSAQPIIVKAQQSSIAADTIDCEPTPIIPNQFVNAELHAADCKSPFKKVFADRYMFRGAAGQLVAVTLSAEAFDAAVYLIGPDNQVVAKDADGSDANARIPSSEFTQLPDNGNYIIEVTSNGSPSTGKYTLLLALGTTTCAYLPTVDTTPYPALGSFGKISISAPAGCAWKITSATPWISPPTVSSGRGDANTSIFVMANNGIAARSGLIYVAGIPYSIPQYGNPRLCSSPGITAGATVKGSLANGDCASAFRVTPNGTPLADRYYFRLTGGQKIAVTMLSSFAGQLHFIGPDATLFGQSQSGSGSSTRFPARGFEPVFTSGDYLIEVTSEQARQTGDYAVMVEIIGGNCSYTVTPESKILASAGDVAKLGVNVNNGCHWHAMSEVNWLTLANGTGGIGSGSLIVTAISNPNASVRSGRVYMAGQFFTFTQLGNNPVASVSAASFEGARLAPGSIIASFGLGMATTTLVAETIPLPTELMGTQVVIKDSANAVHKAGLFFISPGQVNFLMPSGLAEGLALITVTSGDGNLLTGAAEIRNIVPALFSASSDGKGVAMAQVLRVKTDGTQIYEPVAQFDAEQGKLVPAPIEFGEAGDRLFLVLFGSGWKNLSHRAGAKVRINGISLETLYAGPQGDLLGVDQINAELPKQLAGSGEQDIVLTVNNVPANKVKISFK